MSQRGCGFKELEDCLNCNAYLLHSTDVVVGAYQRNVDMWKKIQTTFNHEVVYINHLSHRTVKSLECRLEKISLACTLYGSCLTEAEERNQSGSNEQDIINQALALFKIKDPKHLDFKFTHCWEILKNYPKWVQPEKNQQDENSPLEHGTPISLDSSQLEGTPQDGIRPGYEGRRSGRDATKAKRRLASEKDPMLEEMKNDNSKTHTLLEQQLITFNNAHQAIMDLEQQKLDRKHARKQQKMDMKAATINAEILSKNLADMTPFSKEYWTNKKRVIVNIFQYREAKNI
ncbi:glutathione S-transferase T3-like [Thalictrum thalictroides]|uniref:Glutathione S-transferase T3-like n=1 Tax=Thalictrum thalictroides TaxID=46969 RepID=A0A7J6WM95_THATH|nr:glutathione S-transferase T3-like [Thalictrum thalictroides]